MRMLVTGSTQGIGLETARQLTAVGHDVVLHARNASRADDVRGHLPDAPVVVGDLASLRQVRDLADAAREHGPYDVVVHNAGLGGGRDQRVVTEDGFEELFQVNTLAPYLLTALLPAPSRLVHLTSGLEAQGTWRPDDLQFERRPWDGMQAYCDTKLHDVLLAFAVARRWPDTLSNAVDPGWIKTRMGGAGATDELPDGAETQVWLAASQDDAALQSGRYLKRREVLEPNPVARDVTAQEQLLEICGELTGVAFPG
ncbi:SDR family NAD(P)-dependent oxidoreductase [Egicoccus halophilus]|uniref:Short-chain dehydrogenase n=1 Tax=Egicoccus halophilus TaxID=1670830 RepID=A0A8J3AEN8_9ACTN|nr:SDR family NAD(P)-dependent oxidoreductase [Egicoccus halophilus]GGI07177.1 short-chain dehydrogenase [Egicoccus halophilus]